MRETSLMSATWTTAPHSFLIDHTPQGDDSLLPGLCLFTEEWLAQAAMPLFRDTADAGHKQTLISYFDDARVEAQIAALDDKKDAGLTTSLTSALSKLKSAVGRFTVCRTRQTEGCCSMGHQCITNAFLGRAVCVRWMPRLCWCVARCVQVWRVQLTCL